MSDTREINEKYTYMAQALIRRVERFQHLKDVTILCLSSAAEKKSGRKRVYGQCEKVPDKYKWSVPCDFTITLFEPNLVGMRDTQIMALIYHELMHVGYDGDKRYIIPHDLEDFAEVVERFGTHWEAVGAKYKDEEEKFLRRMIAFSEGQE